MMLLYGEDDLLVIPFNFLIFIVCGFPFFAFFSCVILCLIFHWNESTQTQCNVLNLLPSFLNIINTYEPEKYIWRLLLSIHATPRFFLAFAFKNLLITSPLRPVFNAHWFSWICILACAVNVAEVLFLLLLTFISSYENYYLHKFMFFAFIFCTMFYMFLSTWLFDYSGRRRTTSLGESSFQCKVLCCMGFTISLILAFYFFFRHNQYCESGTFTLFALSEYFVIIFNVLFHSTLYYDFHSRSFSLISLPMNYQYNAITNYISYGEKRT